MCDQLTQLTINVDMIQEILDQCGSQSLVEVTMRRNGEFEAEFDAYRKHSDVTIETDEYVEAVDFDRLKDEYADLQDDYDKLALTYSELEEERDSLLATVEQTTQQLKEQVEQLQLLREEMKKSWWGKLVGK